MKNKTHFLLIPIAMAMISCGGGGSSSAAPIIEPVNNSPAPQGLLVPLESQDQLLETVRDSFTQVAAVNRAGTESGVIVDDGFLVEAAVMDSAVPTSSESFTTT